MPLRRFCLLLAGLGLAVSLSVARPAEAATKITVVATGTIQSGADSQGLLTGADDDDLSGLDATMTMIFTEAPFSIIEAGPPEAFAAFSVFSVSFVVGDGSVVPFGNAGAPGSLAFYALIGALGASANITLDAGGGVGLVADFAFNDPAFAPASIFDEFTFTSAPAGGWSFGAALIRGVDAAWEFVATPDAITISVERGVVVPAPAALGLFAVGLLGLCAVRRRV